MLGKIPYTYVTDGEQRQLSIIFCVQKDQSRRFTGLVALGIRTSDLVRHERRKPFILFPPGLCGCQTRITININVPGPTALQLPFCWRNRQW